MAYVMAYGKGKHYSELSFSDYNEALETFIEALSFAERYGRKWRFNLYHQYNGKYNRMITAISNPDLRKEYKEGGTLNETLFC